MTLAIRNQVVRIRGTVQGVGFRPTVYRLATECRLTGEVLNDSEGVLIRLSGSADTLQTFLQKLKSEAPPLSKIDAIEVQHINSNDWQYNDFSISPSDHSPGCTEVAADAASCQACLDEIFNPQERRFFYPFANCTHCGPRLSIIQAIPYDRSNTTMQSFALCKACRAEYQNPLDRRFHAQPVACHQCGPELAIHNSNTINENNLTENHNTAEENSFQYLQQINQALLDGRIIAIKGLGGFHLCCDARNHKSVSLLRERKQRYAKPFALMTHNLNTIAQYCHLSALEKETLQSSAAPIVLLKEKQSNKNVPALSSAIAPGSNLLGFMLPYTPLHSIISHQFGHPLVMSSGNISGEPQIIDNQQAIENLSDIADLIVYHNRDIASRIDDSVVRCIAGKARLVRRARGYAPRSVILPEGFEKADSILAFGAQLKSTFCLVQQGSAILSQHQGDLESLSTFDDYEKNISLYKSLFQFSPQHLAHDKHPEYLSTKLAKQYADKNNLTLTGVQHHHAHIASAMAENQLPADHAKVLGIALDGLGFGEDNTLWGGEFLLADYCDFKRIASFTPIAMPGASKAIEQPWRNALAHILNSMSWDTFIREYAETDIAKLFNTLPVAVLLTMLRKGLHCPKVSSAGRLFDAVAATIGLSAEHVQFEGQAAIELEMLVDSNALLAGQVNQPYTFTIEQHQNNPLRINAGSIWPSLLNDIRQGVSNCEIATRFHAGLINALVDVVERLCREYSFKDVVLSGGCLQNAVLLEALDQQLGKRHLNCLSHALVPANDGGIALGQAVVCAAKAMKQKNKI
ncbi:[NiFe] hydrogenase metallocenter assembly protein HypF [hydrothermal vent metagenome]|uniref:[NiFe] hydrogenase metallocenter assembly protein HypF n=1 Tax=hydrothermal vent metagenome TaxID=652676 RepID=A0A3B0WWD3_9ZZZZ